MNFAEKNQLLKYAYNMKNIWHLLYDNVIVTSLFFTPLQREQRGEKRDKTVQKWTLGELSIT